ncbi:MAG: hypothetical protein KDC66_02550 [Phaeodactylibacter sp.]|nr:hypothetical protein [Phaeodactylibacter sp.]MCB9275323.1 hypothetical protein [Lewinellaceae bacterium]
MRIAGYIDHPALKITIFQLENKFIVKFESGLFELAYKYRMGEGVDSVQDIHHLVDDAFIHDVQEQMAGMRRTHAAALQRQAPGDDVDEAFEEII